MSDALAFINQKSVDYSVNEPASSFIAITGNNGMEKDVTPAQIEFRNVTKTYGPVAAVKGLSLTVHRGEFLTVLGPSGSGKTTTLMLLAGFQAPNQGDVLIAGKSLAAVPSYRRDQGIVLQSYALFPHLTCVAILNSRSKCVA